jgi:hypothetical protein
LRTAGDSKEGEDGEGEEEEPHEHFVVGEMGEEEDDDVDKEERAFAVETAEDEGSFIPPRAVKGESDLSLALGGLKSEAAADALAETEASDDSAAAAVLGVSSDRATSMARVLSAPPGFLSMLWSDGGPVSPAFAPRSETTAGCCRTLVLGIAALSSWCSASSSALRIDASKSMPPLASRLFFRSGFPRGVSSALLGSRLTRLAEPEPGLAVGAVSVSRAGRSGVVVAVGTGPIQS